MGKLNNILHYYLFRHHLYRLHISQLIKSLDFYALYVIAMKFFNPPNKFVTLNITNNSLLASIPKFHTKYSKIGAEEEHANVNIQPPIVFYSILNGIGGLNGGGK